MARMFATGSVRVGCIREFEAGPGADRSVMSWLGAAFGEKVVADPGFSFEGCEP